jgi:hypothetical protein
MPRRTGAWRRFVPARLFEPAGLAAAAALLLTLLLGASVLMRARVAMDEGSAASHEVRGQQAPPGQAPTAPSSQAPTPERLESSPTPPEVAAGRGPELTNVEAKSGGGPFAVRDAPRKRAGARSAAFSKARQRAAAPFEQTAAREGEAGALETLGAEGRARATSLFDGTRLMAKEQLIYALRLTGAKLKEVQSKAHGADGQKAGAGVR